MNEQPASLLTVLKTLPRPVWILFFGTFLNKFGTFVIPFLSLYLTSRGFSIPQAGIAISAYGVGNLLASLVGGHLADSLGRRNTIICSMFSVAAAMMMLSQAQSFPAILIFTALAGFTGEMYRPASAALLADLAPEGNRVTVYSAYRIAFNAGWAFGPATAGFLAGHSYFWLFVGDAVSSVLFGIVAWVALPHGVRAATQHQGWRPALKIMSHDKAFLRILAASVCISLVFLQMGSTFSLHVTSLGFSPTTYGALISLNGVLVVLCELPITRITQRFSATRMMALGYALVGTGFALNSMVGTLPALVVVVCVFTLGEMISIPVSGGYVADLAPEQYRGRYTGAVGLTSALALVCGPSVGMTIFNRSPLTLWLVCGAFGWLGAGIILWEPKSRRHVGFPYGLDFWADLGGNPYQI